MNDTQRCEILADFLTLLNAFEDSVGGASDGYGDYEKQVREERAAVIAAHMDLIERIAIQALHIEAIGKELVEANAACDAWEAQAHGK